MWCSARYMRLWVGQNYKVLFNYNNYFLIYIRLTYFISILILEKINTKRPIACLIDHIYRKLKNNNNSIDTSKHPIVNGYWKIHGLFRTVRCRLDHSRGFECITILQHLLIEVYFNLLLTSYCLDLCKVWICYLKSEYE